MTSNFRFKATLAILAMGMSSFCWGQDLAGYLKQRRIAGITQSSGLLALESFQGSRTLEVKGTLKGTLRSQDRVLILLEMPGGQPLSIQASAIPDWMRSGDIEARLIIKAQRHSEHSEVIAALVAAVPNSLLPNDPKPKPSVSKTSGRTKQPLSSGSLRGPINPSRGSKTSRKSFSPAPSKGNWNLPASEALPHYEDYISNYNRKLPKSEVTRIAQSVIGFSLQFGVDARLIMAIVLCESGFDPKERSHAGARGLGQLMPGTAAMLGVNNSYDSVENLYGTVKLVRQHLDKYTNQTGGDEFQSLILALAAYNAGPGSVKKFGGVPPYRETQNYVRKVVKIYNQLAGSP